MPVGEAKMAMCFAVSSDRVAAVPDSDPVEGVSRLHSLEWWFFVAEAAPSPSQTW